MSGKLEDRILKQLSKRKSGYTSKELSTLIHRSRNYVQRTLRNLVAKSQVTRTGTASLHYSPIYKLPNAAPSQE